MTVSSPYSSQCQKKKMTKTDFDIIDSFDGDFQWLSSFWMLRDNFQVTLDDESPAVYASVEHAYQAAKFVDLDIRKRFRQSSLTSGQAKRLGGKNAPAPIRKDWEQIKFRVMKSLVEQKFKDPFLEELLKMTGDVPIIEGNKWHDNFWGDCSCDACDGKLGANHLGVILMEVRNQCS